ncbi:unnamed protein product, partial [Ectocarpus sp. 4 AP-2014]
MGPRVFDQTPDAPLSSLASPPSSHQLQGGQKLTPPMKQETRRPSPRPRRPPPLPFRPSHPSPAVAEPDADAAAKRAAESIEAEDDSAAAGLVSSAAHDERLLHLAKLMLSPEGLAMRKITLEGYSVPVALRLLDRRQQQQQQQQPLEERPKSSRTATAGGRAPGIISPLLAITWLDSDTFGFDLRGVTSIRPGHQALGSEGAAAGRKRSRGGGGSGSYHNTSLVLSWGSAGEIGPSTLILAATSRELRDLVMLTLEMLVDGLQGGRDDDVSAGGEGVGSTAAPHVVQQGIEEGGREGEQAGSSDAEPATPTATTTSAADTDSDDEEAAAVLARFDDDAADCSFFAPPQTDPPSSATPHHAGGLRERLFSSDAAAASAERSSRRRASLGLHRRGVSFSSAGAEKAASVVHGLERARTVGASVIGRESDAGLVLEQEQEARRRREQAMARLLAVYDRARDEAQAAACRLGAVKLKRLLSGAATRQMERCWTRWCGAVRQANDGRQRADRRLWHLHAKANQNNDLLAWYHATFSREVYRRRVPFWFRETNLRPYQKAYRIVDDGDSYTPMERSIMTSCVCTVGTKYADVAAQLFTAKDVLSPEEYRLFQVLVKRGAEVPKAASKSGRKLSHPMKLRLWFNRGALCLTAKRNKPDGTASKDHSFYLSKVKTCLVAVTAAVRDAGGSSRRGSRNHFSSSSSSSGSGHSDAAVTPRLPSDASDNASPGGRRNKGGLTTSATSSSSALALSSSLPFPVPPKHLPGAAGAAAAGSWRGSLEENTAYDEADRGAGGGNSRSLHGSSSGGGAVLPPPPAAKDQRPDGDGDGDASSVVRAGEDWSSQQACVMSIHFFGRTMTLDLWFASETEAVEWQGMLTKLSWKEQGYLYGAPSGDSGGGGGHAGGHTREVAPGGRRDAEEGHEDRGSGRGGGGGGGGSGGGGGMDVNGGRGAAQANTRSTSCSSSTHRSTPPPLYTKHACCAWLIRPGCHR